VRGSIGLDGPVGITRGENSDDEQNRGKKQKLAHDGILACENQGWLNGRMALGTPWIMVTRR
jgi:hypothetical protein